jgi:tetratricopeptide (TPR) repeat protein
LGFVFKERLVFRSGQAKRFLQGSWLKSWWPAWYGSRKPSAGKAQWVSCLDWSRNFLGDDDPRTLSIWRTLAWVQVALDQAARAMPLAAQALERHRYVMGDQHPFTLIAIGILARAYQAQGRYAEAAPLIAEARAGYRRLSKDDGCRMASVLGMLGENLVAEKKYAEAEPPLRECLATWERRPPHDGEFFMALSPQGAAREYAFAKSLLGASLLGQRRHAEAEPLLVQGYQGLTPRTAARDARSIPLDKRRRIEALGWLVQLYEEWGKPDEAAKWRAELESAKAVTKSAVGK